MITMIYIFVSYFIVITVTYGAVTLLSSNTKEQRIDFIKSILVLALSMSIVLTILVRLIDFSLDFTLVILLIGLGMIEENVFIPMLMGDKYKNFSRKAMIGTVIVANLVELGILYFFVLS